MLTTPDPTPPRSPKRGAPEYPSSPAPRPTPQASLSKDQTITTGDDGWEIVEATVPDTMELRGWIYSYAPVIEVLAPEALREEIAETARGVAARHS